MRPERPLDDEPTTPAGEGGIARTYSIAFVCVLSLIAGGAAAFALYHTRQGAAEVRGIAVETSGVGHESGPEALAAEGPVAGGVRAGGGEISAAGDVAVTEAEDETAVSAGTARRRGTGLRAGAQPGARVGDDVRPARRYARAPNRQVAAGGRGVGGHALGGLKKTGEGVKKTGVAVGKTFGKIGGIFHD